MIKLAVYLMFLAVLGYTGLIYGSKGILLCVFGGGIYAVLAYLFVFFQMFRMRFSFSVPIAVGECGKQVEMEWKIQNKSAFPVSKIRFFFRYENVLTGEKGRLCLKGAADGSRETVVSHPVMEKHCGRVCYELRKVRIYDFTGYFYLTKWERQKVELNVLPPIYETIVTVTEQSRYFMGESEIYDSAKPGDDVSEVLLVRPFCDGDRIQNIHWKMTARTGELMVREQALPLGAPVVLLLESAGMGQKTDAFLILAAAVSYSLIGEKCAHYIAWPSIREKDILRIRVDREEDLYLFLFLFYEETGKPDAADIRLQYREKYRLDPAVTEIYINRKLEIYVRDELLRKMNKNTLEQELNEVEFIV